MSRSGGSAFDFLASKILINANVDNLLAVRAGLLPGCFVVIRYNRNGFIFIPMAHTDKKINETFSENALKMMRKRYLAKDGKGNQETPAQMFRRVARALAKVEREHGHNQRFINRVEEEFFNVMASKEFTPAGRTVTNGGADTALIANCIVLPIHDSMDDIFQTLKDASLLQQAGSGLGFALDELRPTMSPTVRSRGVSSGPVSFLKIYNEAFGTIKQQGRHGANMAMMSVDHPDILDFVRSKKTEGEIRNFNISVKVTDEFMQQLIDGSDKQWYCTWKGEKMKPRRVLRHPNGAVHDTEELDITAGEIFDELVNYAWTNGEPGIVFIDSVNKTNPLPGLGEIFSSNPCGEQFLHPYDNCNLGSINLAKFVVNGKVDYAHLRTVTKIAVRMLDNVIDKFDFPVKQVSEMARKNRRIGLGIMGFADMLYQLGIRYDSEKGIETAEKVISVIQKAAEQMSRELAKEKEPFPNHPHSIFKEGDRRNAALTTVAPTGSVSMMFDASSGIEPNFALSYVKQDKDGEQYPYLNVYFEEALEKLGYSEEKIVEIQEKVVEKGSIQHITELPQSIRDTFVVAMDIPGEDHIRMQAAFQKYVDNSISKTINLPNDATHDDVKESFILAWKLGCKSCTVYRDGSRTVQILHLGKGDNIIKPTETAEKRPSIAEEVIVREERKEFEPRVRPEVMSGKTYRVKTGYGKLYITINNDENGDPFEVFATIGKTGGFFQEQSEGICRIISLSLRSGIKVEEIIDNLKGIRGPMPVFTNLGTILSLPDAIGQILEEHVGLRSGETKEQKQLELEKGTAELIDEIALKAEVSISSGDAVGNFVQGKERQMADYGSMPGCPDCGEPLHMSEGCINCLACGFSRCT